MCCGQKTKPIQQKAEIQQAVLPPPVNQVEMVQQFVNNNENSQRAAEVLRTNFLKLRFNRGG